MAENQIDWLRLKGNRKWVFESEIEPLSSLSRRSVLKYHESGREKDCLPSVGQWNMMNNFDALNVCNIIDKYGFLSGLYLHFNISFKIFINSYIEFILKILPIVVYFDWKLLKYHDSVREKDCLPSVGHWNMMNKIRMINGGIIFCVIIVLKFFVPKRAEMAKNKIVR
ncbi:hypothetical protein CASFOL_003999 [Castilleja foliolosa]|uniref:Uncharacterized protein n=1 Tax=Castilleja foliolosa TaxID=1961234 RepID=A0ABD3EJ57_9LAMI